jgi:polyribonucleotide nucleotidyltransferase
MQAGVPLKRPVSGIAMGLVREGERFTILTDIQGLEDALGDMDFKVAGTTQGVTAIQMDIKMAGITREILAAALAQAKRGRAAILDRMLETIAVPVAELSPYAPRAAVMTIETAKIREVIGAGGKTIRKIIEETGADIDIHEDGMVFISSPDAAGAAQAQQIIADIVRDIAVGEVYDGTVTRLMDFGVFVKLLPGREGLCHISQLADHRVAKVEDVVQPGDRLRVKVVEIDSKGRINLSHKALL